MCKAASRPTAKQIRSVANRVGQKYSSALCDALSTSSGGKTFHGLAYKIKCRIENARRGCKRLSEELCGGPLKRATARTTYGCTEWQPPVTAIDFNDCEEAKKMLLAESSRGAKHSSARRTLDACLCSNSSDHQH